MLSSQLILLRKCIECGLEAHDIEDLEYFCKAEKSRYGYQNHCKKCHNRRCRDPLKYRASRDRALKKWNKINHPKQIGFLGKNILLKENPRTNVCTKCGHKYPEDLKQQTCMHHEKYDPENPLAHTVELCKSCHNRLHNQARRLLSQ